MIPALAIAAATLAMAADKPAGAPLHMEPKRGWMRILPGLIEEIDEIGGRFFREPDPARIASQDPGRLLELSAAIDQLRNDLVLYNDRIPVLLSKLEDLRNAMDDPTTSQPETWMWWWAGIKDSVKARTTPIDPLAPVIDLVFDTTLLSPFRDEYPPGAWERIEAALSGDRPDVQVRSRVLRVHPLLRDRTGVFDVTTQMDEGLIGALIQDRFRSDIYETLYREALRRTGKRGKGPMDPAILEKLEAWFNENVPGGWAERWRAAEVKGTWFDSLQGLKGIARSTIPEVEYQLEMLQKDFAKTIREQIELWL
jgi:hypothetical protein